MIDYLDVFRLVEPTPIVVMFAAEIYITLVQYRKMSLMWLTFALPFIRVDEFVFKRVCMR